MIHRSCTGICDDSSFFCHLVDVEPAVRVRVVLLLVPVVEDAHELLPRAGAAHKALQHRRGRFLLRIRKEENEYVYVACAFLERMRVKRTPGILHLWYDVRGNCDATFTTVGRQAAV